MIFQALADALGIPSAALEGGAITLLALALFYLVRLLLKKEDQDTVQLGFSQQLVMLTSNAVEESRKLREAYESNVLAITHIGDVLTSLKGAFDTMASDVTGKVDTIGKQFSTFKKEIDQAVNPLGSVLSTIHKDLIRNAETKILVHNPDGQPRCELKVFPIVNDENGEVVLRVEYTDMEKNDE